MTALKINDIREWLIDNRSEYQILKSREFPPFDNPIYSTYEHLYDFIQYYQYKEDCNMALLELKDDSFANVSLWTKKYEKLGSQDLLMFEVNYIKWDEDVSSEQIKIHEGLYTERKPFANVLCFCKVFQHLYWDNCVHETELSESEKLQVITELKVIWNSYYLDKPYE